METIKWIDKPVRGLCEEHTPLHSLQVNLLEHMEGYLDFGESISDDKVSLAMLGHEGILLYTEGHFLRRGGVKEPSGSKRQGCLLAHDALPVITSVLERGKLERVRMASSVVSPCELAGYPIIDSGGKSIGVVLFSTLLTEEEVDGLPLGKDGQDIVRETICQAMLVPQEDRTLYQPLSLLDGVIVFDDQGTIMYANDSAKRLADALGLDRRLVGASIYGGALKTSALKVAAEEQRGLVMDNRYGNLALQEVMLPIMMGNREKRNLLFIKDRTTWQIKEQELLVKNSVIKEIHHRVKNNLQSVASLLRMAARRSEEEVVRRELQASISRIESMSLVHDFVSHYDEERIAVRTIVEELFRLLRHALVREDQSIYTEFIGSNYAISSHKASYVSLVLNELISNSFKHGFADRQEGNLSVYVRDGEDGKHWQLIVKDDGRGLPEGEDIFQSGHLGLQIIRHIVEGELHGTIQWLREDGTTVVIDLIKDED